MSASVISVVGVKDACGASTLALNLGFLLQKLSHKKVLLLDYDFSYCGDLLLSLNQKEPACATDLIGLAGKKGAQKMLEGFIPHHPKGVHLLQALDTRKKVPPFSPEDFDRVFALLAEAFDYIVVDGGSSWTPYHLHPFLGSSLIFLVAQPRRLLLKEAAQKVTRLMSGFVPKSKLNVVLNRSQKKDAFTAHQMGEHFSGLNCFYLPDRSDKMEEAEGEPLCLKDVRDPYTLEVEKIVRETLLQKKLTPYSPAEPSSAADWGTFLPFWAAFNGQPSAAAPAHSPTHAAAPAPPVGEWDQLKSQILKQLLKVVDFKAMGLEKSKDQKDEQALREKTREAILKILNAMGDDAVEAGKKKQLVKEVLDEALGLGPLEGLLADPKISEIMINGKNQIYIEEKGKLKRTPLRFSSDDQLSAIIERIVAPIGRRVDESTPLVDARLKDGSRVNIIIPPLSLVGPVVTIRRFSQTPLQVEDLVRYGTLSEGMAEFLRAAIEARLNIVVSGGTGSGKTTLLNVLSSFISNEQRIVTIEDAAELKLSQEHVISLESRPPNIEGKGDIPIRTLLKNSLRMRPDRIVIGECRGGEALDMLQAMNTGHDGSLTTIHSNTPRDCVSRLETLVMYAGVQLPSRAIRGQIAAAIDVIVQLNRLSDGSRKITKISEVTGMEGDVITLQDIFAFNQEKVDADKKVIGKHAPTGVVPRFVETLRQRGIELSRKYFQT